MGDPYHLVTLSPGLFLPIRLHWEGFLNQGDFCMDAILQTLARELERSPEHVQNVVTLIDEGATIPFIARYRKELHGSMDDQLLRRLADRLQYLRNLEARKGRSPPLSRTRASSPRSSPTPSLRPPLWRRWRTCTAPISRSGAPGPPSPGRRGWNPWPGCSPLRARRWTPSSGGPGLSGPGQGGGDGGGRPPGASDILAEEISDDADIRKGAAAAVSAPGHAGLPGCGQGAGGHGLPPVL